MANNPPATIAIEQISVPRDEGRDLRLDRVRKKLTRPEPRDLRQGILRKRSWSAKLNNIILFHGVSFPSWI